VTRLWLILAGATASATQQSLGFKEGGGGTDAREVLLVCLHPDHQHTDRQCAGGESTRNARIAEERGGGT
jgi:hypothetical protein